MPVIFLLSACVSGIAGIIVTYLIIKPLASDSECIRSCIKFLWGFFILDFVFEMLEIGMHAYQSTHHWHALHELFWGPLYQSYWIYQVLIFSVIPFLILMGLSLIRFNNFIVKFFGFIASAMILFQVLLMRWNVVIGGQLMSKSEQGVVSFHPEWIAKEGIIPAIIIMILPLIILFILSKVFPFWLPAESESSSSK
jgi:predicted membrane protein